MVMVHGHIADLIKRRDFILARGGLIVAATHWHPQLVKFALHFHHIGKYALGDHAEILVAEFLPFGRACAKKSASGDLDIGTGKVKIMINGKILLLKPGIGHYGQFRLNTEKAQHPLGFAIEGLA